MDSAQGGLGSKLHELWSKLKKIKNIEFVLCVFILAIVLLVYAGVSSAATKKTSEPAVTESVSTSQMTDNEKRVAALLSNIGGVGEVTVLMSLDAEGVCQSVVVVAEGAEDVATRLKILEAVETALQVPASAIEIYSM